MIFILHSITITVSTKPIDVKFPTGNLQLTIVSHLMAYILTSYRSYQILNATKRLWNGIKEESFHQSQSTSSKVRTRSKRRISSGINHVRRKTSIEDWYKFDFAVVNLIRLIIIYNQLNLAIVPQSSFFNATLDFVF